MIGDNDILFIAAQIDRVRSGLAMTDRNFQTFTPARSALSIALDRLNMALRNRTMPARARNVAMARAEFRRGVALANGAAS